MAGAFKLLPTGFSIGSVKIYGETLLQLLQLNVPGVFGFKALKDPEEERKLVTKTEI